MRTTLVPIEQRQQLRHRIEVLDEILRTLYAEPIETDLMYQPEGARRPVVIWRGVVCEWVMAAITEAREQLAAIEREG